MQRDYRTYFEDILMAIGKIERYTEKLTFKDFKDDELKVDGAVRNLEIIGEAGNHISEGIKSKFSTIEWAQIVGMRNVFVHEYFGVDTNIVWEIIKDDLPELKEKVIKILESLE